MDEKKEKVLAKVREEIERIDKKENNVFFFVVDTKGVASGSLEYIYKLAKIAKEDGYNVGMLYQAEKDDEFVGVEGWLGKEYSELPHYNVATEQVDITPGDILFIPEIFSSVMNQTKKLPCKRIAIMQNFDYMVEQMPFAAQWGDFGVLECITNTKDNAELVDGVFPYVRTTVITPYIDKVFGDTKEPKQLIVNIVASDQSDINKIVKPFYWKYPSFKWVSFKDLRGFSKEEFAKALREAAVTVWVDENTSFGYSALEAMKSGSIVIAKMPKRTLPWTEEATDTSVTKFKGCCVWFEDFNTVQRQIATVVRAWMTDSVPEKLIETAKETASEYTEDKTAKAFTEYLENVLSARKQEMDALVKNFSKESLDTSSIPNTNEVKEEEGE